MILQYWHKVTWLLSSSKSYVFLLKESLSSAFAFYVVSMLLLSFSSVVLFNLRVAPQLQHSFSQVLQEISQHFPPQLSIAWTGSNLSLEGTPLTVGYPQALNPAELHLPSSLAILIPEEVAGDQLNQASSLIVITPSRLHVRNRANQWVQFLWSEILQPEQLFTLNQHTLPTFIASSYNLADDYRPWLQLLISVVIPAGFIISGLWEVVINTLLVHLCFYVQQTRLSWKKSLQLTLYLSLPAHLIQQLSAWLYPSSDFPIYTVSFWVLFVVIYLTAIRQKLGVSLLPPERP